MKIETKLIPIKTEQGEYNVWIQRCGDNPTKRLLLLHGGPGMSHEYFKSFDKWFADSDIEYIYYDQLGSHKSDKPSGLSLWTIERFVDEVDQVRTALGLGGDNFFLLGHSWGGVLAIEYALKHPDALKGLIISNMMADCIAYQKYADEVLAPQFKPATLKRIKSLEEEGLYESEEYEELLVPYYERHVLRQPMGSWPDSVLSSLSHVNKKLYVHMQGPSEFGISGVLATWDRSKDLSSIKVPTLTIGAEHDTMDPSYMKWMASEFPKGSYLYCRSAGHMAMWDNPVTYHKGIEDFIEKI